MPYTVDNQTSAGSDLAQAIGYGAGAAAFVPAVWKLGGMAAKGLWHGAIKPAAKIAGVGIGVTAAVPLGAAYLGVATAPGRKVTGFLAKRAFRTGAEIGKTVIGGTAAGAYTVAKMAYKHPYIATGLAGAAGVGISAVGSPPPSSSVYSPGMVEMMGGTSNYGVGAMMSDMNATGDLVLGANNRRR